VRSVNLDQWKESEVLMMENGGNEKVNAIFEAHLSVNKPTNTASGPVRERFIRDKYERRKFYDPSAFERVSQMENARDQEKVISGVQRRLASSGSRKPSDAAKKRVEERAARNRDAVSAVRSIKTVKAPAPTRELALSPSQAPVVDLLDFGNFNSPEANSAVEASERATAISAHAVAEESNQEPQLDLFGSMTLGNNPKEGGNIGQLKHLTQPQQTVTPAERPVGSVDQKKMSTSDIMSMFNSGSAQHNSMHQNMFAMQGGMPNNTMLGGLSGSHNIALMGQQMGGGGTNANNMTIMGNINPHEQYAMMNSMQMTQQNNSAMGQSQQLMGNMDGNNMGHGMNMNHPQMQRNVMMRQHQQSMNYIGGNNMGSVMGTNMGQNGMMMHQQQQGQMPQMNTMITTNNNMAMQGGRGEGLMHQQQGGNQYGQSILGGQTQPSQNQMNHFSDLGNFGR